MRRAISIVVALASLAPTPARADQGAEALYAEGEAAYASGRYLAAAHAFETAFAESHRPRLLWNVAQSYRRQFEIEGDVGYLRRAREVYKNFLDLSSLPADRADAQLALEQLSRQIDAIERRARQWAAAEAAQAAQTPPPPRTGTSLAAPIAVAGSGVAVAGAGLVLWLLGRSAADTVNGTGTPAMPVPYARVADDARRAPIYAAASYACFGVGAALALTGVVLAVVRHHRADARAPIALHAGGASLDYAW